MLDLAYFNYTLINIFLIFLLIRYYFYLTFLFINLFYFKPTKQTTYFIELFVQSFPYIMSQVCLFFIRLRNFLDLSFRFI